MLFVRSAHELDCRCVGSGTPDELVKGLVAKPEDWNFQGELFKLDWYG